MMTWIFTPDGSKMREGIWSVPGHDNNVSNENVDKVA